MSDAEYWADWLHPIKPWNCTEEAGKGPLLPSYQTWQTRTFLAASIAGLLYFLWEHGPCHSTRLAEMYYLFTCVSVMTVALVLRAHTEGEGRAVVAYDLNRLLAVMVAMRIYASVVSLKPLGAFYRAGDIRPFAQMKAPSDDTSLLAHRIATELESHLRQIIARRDKGLLDPIVFPLLMFPLLFMQQETLIYFGVARVVYYPAKIAAPMVALSWTLLEIPRICRRVQTMAKVHSLLCGLLDAASETRDRELVREVYRRVNMANVLQATDYHVHKTLINTALKKDLLDSFSKAVLLNGLQKYGISGWRQDWVLDLIQSSKSHELTELKSFLDSTGDYNSLYKLVYVDIRNSLVRDQVLEHIHTQACIARRNHADGAVGMKILSDIDDTLLCSGGSFPAGCDDRIPKHMVYPGCGCLFQALDRSWKHDEASCNLVFLSARPHVYKDLAENKSFYKFKELFSTGKLHCIPSLLPGSLALGAAAVTKALFMAQHAWRDVGERKAESYWKFKALYEEYDFILFGDNGQGDLLTGQLIRQKEQNEQREQEEDDGATESSCSTCSSSSKSCREAIVGRGFRISDYLPEIVVRSCCRRRWKRPVCAWQGSQLRAVMIHEVIKLETSMGLESVKERGDDWRQQLADQRIYVFSSYPAAALKLHEVAPDLISTSQLRQVAEVAIDEFDHARVLYPEWEDCWAPIQDRLAFAMRHINYIVAEAGERMKPLRTTHALLENACRRSILLGINRPRIGRNRSRTPGHSPQGRSALGDVGSSEDEDISGAEQRLSEYHTPAELPAVGPDVYPYPGMMTRIGSAWREMQALADHDAL